MLYFLLDFFVKVCALGCCRYFGSLISLFDLMLLLSDVYCVFIALRVLVPSTRLPILDIYLLYKLLSVVRLLRILR